MTIDATPEPFADRSALIDLGHRGYPSAIAAAVLELSDGIAIVDPGPASTLPALERGLAAQGVGWNDVHAVLLTHIHLDHAGASGSIVQRNPSARVYVHERGAGHMRDPERLLASAARIFGDEMDTLWGEFLPIADPSLVVLTGGEHLDVRGRALHVAYTPGHASHHVSYLDESTGTAFVGDTLGGRVRGASAVVPATPPPDLDLDALRESWDVVRAWHPTRAFLTHFGTVEAIDEHIARLDDRLRSWTEYVLRSLDGDESAEAREEAFIAWVDGALRGELGEAGARAYAIGVPSGMSYQGLARYWSKRAQGD